MDGKIETVTPRLSERYDRALLFASDAHRGQKRKNGEVPYLSHLLRVSGLVLDYGGTEDVAIGALLHDAVEDCGGLAMLERIRATFGDQVAQYVLETSDSVSEDSENKAPWRERKERYIRHMSEASDGAALICGCDKLDNARSLTRYLVEFNDFSILNRFHAGREEEFWYWDSVATALEERGTPVARELRESIETLRRIWV